MSTTTIIDHFVELNSNYEHNWLNAHVNNDNYQSFFELNTNYQLIFYRQKYNIRVNNDNIITLKIRLSNWKLQNDEYKNYEHDWLIFYILHTIDVIYDWNQSMFSNHMISFDSLNNIIFAKNKKNFKMSLLQNLTCKKKCWNLHWILTIMWFKIKRQNINISIHT